MGKASTLDIVGSVVDVKTLNESEITAMFDLMSEHYDNTNYDRFKKDLFEKSWTVLLRDIEKKIRGFTTLQMLDMTVDNITVKGVFSGDTIIHREYWGSMELHKVWVRFVLSLALSNGDIPFYWFLICKGYKTYRFLPVYFHNFYPNYNTHTPLFEKKLMDHLGKTKFKDNYDYNTGVIKFNGERDYLKTGIADITEPRMKDPDIGYFMKSNPGYFKGDELICIARVSEDNLKPFVHTKLLKG